MSSRQPPALCWMKPPPAASEWLRRRPSRSPRIRRRSPARHAHVSCQVSDRDACRTSGASFCRYGNRSGGSRLARELGGLSPNSLNVLAVAVTLRRRWAYRGILSPTWPYKASRRLSYQPPDSCCRPFFRLPCSFVFAAPCGRFRLCLNSGFVALRGTAGGRFR